MTFDGAEKIVNTSLNNAYLIRAKTLGTISGAILLTKRIDK